MTALIISIVVVGSLWDTLWWVVREKRKTYIKQKYYSYLTA